MKYVHTKLTYYDYADYVKIQNAFVVSCFAKVADTEYEYYGTDDFRIRKPMVAIEVSDVDWSESWQMFMNEIFYKF